MATSGSRQAQMRGRRWIDADKVARKPCVSVNTYPRQYSHSVRLSLGLVLVLEISARIVELQV